MPAVLCQSAVVDANGSLVPKWNQLDHFWKKHNKVLLDKLAIERERNRLQAENSRCVWHMDVFVSNSV